MMHISPTNKMPEPELAQVITPDIIAVPVYRRNPDSAFPDLSTDLGEYWGYNSDFLD
jgi:hypothetical protein